MVSDLVADLRRQIHVHSDVYDPGWRPTRRRTLIRLVSRRIRACAGLSSAARRASLRRRPRDVSDLLARLECPCSALSPV